MSLTKVSAWIEGKILFHVIAVRVDICDSHTIIYPAYGDEAHPNKYTIHLPQSLKSVNIERGTVTAYFNNDGYLVLTDA